MAPAANQFDLYYSAWVLSHESHALASTSATLADANIYHPATGAFFYGPGALGALPLFAPVYLATGNTVLAVNVTFLLGLALTGVAMHVVVRRWTGSHLAGAVAATTVLVNQWLLRGFVAVPPHWAALCWLPLIAFWAATRLDSVRSAVVLGSLVALQSLTDVVYAAPAVVVPLGVLAVTRLLRSSTRAVGARLILALALAAAMLAPLYREYWAVQAANPNLALQTQWPVTEATFPAPMPDRLFHGGAPFLLTPVAIGLTVLGLAAMAWRRRTGAPAPPVPGGWAHGALWAVTGGCLALNPLLQFGGEELLSPLGHLTEWIPALRVIRVPSRLGIAGLVGLGILSGVAFAEVSALMRRVWSRRIGLAASWALAAIVLVLVHRAYVGNYWTQEGPGIMPDEYRLQAAPEIPEPLLPALRSSRAPLLELPLGSMMNPSADALAMFHSTSHWRPLLNGYSSYWPAGYQERLVDAKRLPALDALDRLAETTGLSLVWVHTQWLGPRQRAQWTSPPGPSGDRRGLTLVAQAGPELLFAVDPPPGSGFPAR